MEVGVSYGGGLALLGAGADERVSAACALSGWTDLTSSLLTNENSSPKKKKFNDEFCVKTL